MNTTPGALDERSARVGRTIPRVRLAARIGDALETGSLIVTAGAGYGKTTALEQGLGERVAVWLTCSEAERAPAALLMRIVEGVAEVAPGASDAVAERLASGTQRVDVRATTRELLADLRRLLVEPLVLVIDDAEQLDEADASQGLISELLRAEVPLLRIAVASRRPLGLRVAKTRAAGRVVEMSAADLAFDAEECGAVLRALNGRDPTSEEISAVMEATEGWPLGIALAAGAVGRGAAGPEEALASLTST